MALFLKIVGTKIIGRDYDAIMHRTGVEITKQSADTAEQLIPYSDLLTTGEMTWPELKRPRPTEEELRKKAAND